MPSITILKDALHNKIRLKHFLFVFERIDLWNYNFLQELLLLDDKKNCGVHLYTKHINSWNRQKMVNLDLE